VLYYSKQIRSFGGLVNLLKRSMSAGLATALVLFTVGCATAEQASTSTSPESSQQPAEITKEIYPPVSLDDLDPDFVRKIAFQEVKQFLIASSPAQDKVNHVIDKGVNTEAVQQAINQVPIMAGFFEDIDSVDDYTFIWTTRGGSKNLGKLLCDEAGYCDVGNPAQFCSAGELIDLTVYCEMDPNDVNNYLFPMWHAYGHLQQYAVSGPNRMPNWFGEGTASYFEGHFSGLYFGGSEYTTFGNSLSFLREGLYEYKSIVVFESPATKKNIIDALIATTDHSGRYNGWEQAQLGYYLGFLAVEALIASEGFETFKEFWRMTAEKDFYESFEAVYGLSNPEFFKKLAPYAVEMMERDRF
jgi:hypothetical protein